MRTPFSPSPLRRSTPAVLGAAPSAGDLQVDDSRVGNLWLGKLRAGTLSAMTLSAMTLSAMTLWGVALPAHAGADASPKIINGELEEGFPSVFSLGADIGANRLSICTANLITPRILLTAAHCSEDIPLELLVAAGRAFGGPDINDAEQILSFSGATIHEDYVPLANGPRGTLGENDIAVIILAEDAPVRPTLYRALPLGEEVVGTDLVSVGYGITETGRGEGVKRSAALKLDELDPMFLIVENGSNPTESNICSGDSGGPQFAEQDGQWVQWAVHSWGDQNCEQLSGSTRVDVVTEWIADRIEEVHGTRDQCEASGWYGDGACDLGCPAVDPDCLEPEPEEAVDGEEDDAKGGCAAVDRRAPWAALLSLGLLALARRRAP